MTNETLEEFWERFLDSADHREKYADRQPDHWHFCSDRKNADELAELVLIGRKQATASLELAYRMEGESLPVSGEVSIITDWDGHPRCIIETHRVVLRRFRDVPADFAWMEGEGNRSLEHWRRVHEEAFRRELSDLGETFSEDLVVVCEEFCRIF